VSAIDLSFCMIVRNGGNTLAACLDSVIPIADELIVVDTGSTDDSKDIARRCGATVVAVPWQDDFAKARNHYLRIAKGRWILSLDADEQLGVVDKARLIEQLGRYPRTAFMLTIRNYFVSPDASQLLRPGLAAPEVVPGVAYSVSRTVRLFPRLRGIRYTYPVHESLLPALRRQGVAVRPCHIPIHHMGYLYGWQALDQKSRLYGELGARKLAEHPDYFLAYLELGKIRLRAGLLDEAERLFVECLRLNSRCSRAHYYLAIVHVQRGNWPRALDAARQAHKMSPDHDDVTSLVANLEQRMTPS
jgi:glycosyltransferase involved in cell wall biosynthesis